jgi:hypothetical protein
MADVHLETRVKYFILRNEPIASGHQFGDSMNAGRPTELGARYWAIRTARGSVLAAEQMPQCFGASAVVGGAQIFKYHAVVSTD